MFKRLLIDSNSVIIACLHACTKDGSNTYEAEFEGKTIQMPSHLDGYESFLMALKATLRDLNMVPSQVVLVKDGKDNKNIRRKYLTTYKDRPEKPKEFLEAIVKTTEMAEETILSYGGISVVKDGYEADDMIAALAAVTDHIIWSKDKDLLAAGNWWWSGELNPTDKFLGIDRKHIVVYKSLVGDTSDKIPGANGFGEVALTNLIAKFGDDTLDEILDMIKNKELHKLSDYVEDFKPFQKIIDNADSQA